VRIRIVFCHFRSKPKDVGRLRISLAQKKVFRSEAPLFCGEACATRARALQVRCLSDTTLLCSCHACLCRRTLTTDVFLVCCCR
jgi:hypothetical protein